MVALFDVLEKLKKGESIPSKYKPHELIGTYKDCMECHVGSNFLLIWIDAASDMVEIVREEGKAVVFPKVKIQKSLVSDWRDFFVELLKAL